MTITLIIGLPGSGKSFLGTKLAKETGATFIDDIKTTTELELSFTQNKDIIIADMALCSKPTREACIGILNKMASDTNINIIINKIFFENNPTKAHRLVFHRNDGREVDKAIIGMSKDYIIDDGFTPIIIWQPDI